MKLCLIVDDREEDRRSLRRLLSRELPGTQLVEAGTVGEMFTHLGRECDLLFVDISLEPRDGGHDSKGLVAMYDVVDSCPRLPVVVVSAHGAEKLGEIVRASRKCRSIVGFLDKGSYGEKEVAEVIGDARTFIKKWEDERSEQDFVEQVFVEADRNASRKIEEYEQKTRKDAARARLYEEVLHGKSWIERGEAERRISQGQCDVTAYLLSREVEKLVRRLSDGTPDEGRTFYKRVEWIKEVFGLTEKEAWQVNYAWSCRNAVVHGSRSAALSDVRQLNEAFESLRRLKPPGGT